MILLSTRQVFFKSGENAARLRTMILFRVERARGDAPSLETTIPSINLSVLLHAGASFALALFDYSPNWTDLVSTRNRQLPLSRGKKLFKKKIISNRFRPNKEDPKSQRELDSWFMELIWKPSLLCPVLCVRVWLCLATERGAWVYQAIYRDNGRGRKGKKVKR